MTDAPTPLDLDAIEAAIAECRTYNFGMYQADRLAHEHAPALVEEVKRLRAEVAMTARPAPAWDEEAVVEAVATALHGDGCPEDPDEGESCACSDYLREARIAVAVVRDHLPAKPHRDALAAAIRLRHREMGSGVETVTVDDYESADAALALWPGRSEAEGGADRG